MAGALTLPSSMERSAPDSPLAESSGAGRLRGRWLALMAVTLVGYAVIGKGFAYVGYPPVFIGEICLLVGLLAFATFPWRAVTRLPVVGPMLLLLGWCLVRAIPGVRRWGVDGLRDFVVVGYAVFALFVTAAIMADPTRLARMLRWFRVLVRWILIGTPIVNLLYRLTYGSAALTWPWGQASFFQQKEGDVLVHLAGVLAFWVAGLEGATVAWPWLLLLAVDVAVMGAIDRAGMLTFALALGLCLALRHRSRVAWQVTGTLAGMMCLALFALWVTGLRIEVPGGKGRDISFEQVITNLTSMASDTGQGNMDSTKEWRLDWWDEIIRYTFHGEYFWTGKGFGVNLADDDGFQVLTSGALRNPHNVFMTVLGRAGVPGLALWCFAHLSWAAAMLRAQWRARRRGDARWAGVFLFLLAYWLAFLMNGSFDVFLEGPMGGIWFWSVFGAGIGAIWAYHRHPEVLADGVMA